MKVISLINMKGGVGKTTMSVNIADCLARRHSAKVLLVDIDPQFNATQCLMSGGEYVEHLKEGKDTILSVFEQSHRAVASTVNGIGSTTAKKLEDISIIPIKENFDLLPGNLELYRMEMTPGDGRENRLNKFLQKINESNNYDYIIIDTPPTPSIWMTSALLASNYYLIPVKPDPISFTGIDLLQGIVESKKENFDLKIECAGLVLTMVEESTIIYQDALSTLENGRWKGFKFDRVIPKRTAIARTQTDRGFILDLSDSSSKLALSGIVEELVERISLEENGQ